MGCASPVVAVAMAMMVASVVRVMAHPTTSGGADVAIAGHLKGKHRGVISRTAEAVFEALIYLVEKYGKVFPSLEGLAHLARCCRQSVVKGRRWALGLSR
jgi:hypothetical protein